MRKAISLAAIAAVAVPLPIAAQVTMPRAINRSKVQINTPMVRQSATPQPPKPVTVRVPSFPLSQVVVWKGQLPFILFLDRGEDGGNHDSWSYRKAKPPWTFERQVSQDNSISMIARREASQEPCPSTIDVILWGEDMMRNGFTFEPGMTARSAGHVSGDGRGIGYKYIRDDRYERMEIPIRVTPVTMSVAPINVKIHRCEAIIAFDVFVTGPRSADPFAAPKPMVARPPAFSDRATSLVPDSTFEVEKAKLRKPIIRK